MKSTTDLFRMDGRVAIITGGTGHLGLAFGQALVEQGAHVMVVDLDEELCQERAEHLEKLGGSKCRGCPVDLSRPDSASIIVRAALAEFGGIDVLINNAAYTERTEPRGYGVPLERQTMDAWRAALEVNLFACFSLIQESTAALANSHNGSIINIGSIYGLVGPNLSLYEGTSMGNPAAYAGSKGGLIQLTRYLATCLAPKIRVNALSPGGIERGQPELFLDRYCRLTPLGRMGKEEDFKGAILFLASDASKYVTGHNLVVDGGWTAW